MGTQRDNSGKWHQFVSGRLYSDPPIGGGQNMNDDLQENVGDELDDIFRTTLGTVVVGASSWVVSPTSNSLELQIASGTGFFLGQRGATTGTVTLTPVLSTNTIYDVYVQLDDAYTTFDNALMAWKVKFSAQTSGSPAPARSILLATVDTNGVSGVIPTNKITDKRRVHETQDAIAMTISDTAIIPAADARRIQHRISMLAYRIREIIGGANWLSTVPASLATLWTALDQLDTTGHDHSGAPGQGPKIKASNVTVVTNSEITAADVQNALAELHTKKLYRDGSQAMTGPLKLYADPSEDLHAATKRYVDQRLEMKQSASTLIKNIFSTGGTASTIQRSLLMSPLTISTRGGIVRFEANLLINATATIESWQTDGTWNEDLTFRLLRDGVVLTETSVPFNRQIFRQKDDQFITESTLVPIPLFVDPSPGGTINAPIAHSYDLQWVRTSVNNSNLWGSEPTYCVPRGISGRWVATES